jgi:hypothetical protein
MPKVSSKVFRAVRAAAPLALLALASQPALARAPADPGLREASRQLGNPQTQQAVAAMLASLADAMLQIDVSPLAQAADAVGDKQAAKHLRKNKRIANLAGPEARHLPEDIRRKAPAMMTAMAGMASAMEAMLPELARVAQQMKGQVGGALPDDRPVSADEPPAGDAIEE